MGLKAGIVGLPNVGKSTLFNAITKKNILAANYPFATIDPNIGTVTVPDIRLQKLEDMYIPERTIATSFEFTDIAGLVKGASQGEGLGNKFLSHIREVDAICHVVRCFEDSNIIHVENGIDPIRDIEIINVELAISDLEIINGRIARIGKKAQTNRDKDALKELETLEKAKEALEKGIPLRLVEFTNEDLLLLKNFNLITIKPMIYLANVSEDEISNDNKYVNIVENYAKSEGSITIKVCAKLESELSELNDDDKLEMLKVVGLEESGLDKLIKTTYDILGLATYFTVGSDEVRAWTFRKGMNAKECAGIIHSDFEKGFIKAEVISYEDLIKYGSELKVRENGRARLEGKDYIMQDGDICHFRFNV
ncbi:MAG: redox-regulated ATPase YchF [Bacilli bacterium]